MNSEKAKEHFSSYYEGTLDAGLKQQFERALSTNAELNKEYSAFADVMRQLEGLQAPVPEPEFDLHERITRKLDLHIHEQKTRQKPSWTLWLKTVGVSAIAILAIWGAVNQFNRGGGAGTASTIGGTQPQPPFTVMQETPNSVKISYQATEGKSVTVYNEDGSVLRKLGNQDLNMPVNNPNPLAAIVSVKVEGSNEINIIALPGTQIENTEKTDGKLSDMAKAVAARFRTPVVIVTTDPNMAVKWNLDAPNAMAVLTDALAGTTYSCEQRKDGLILVDSN